MNNEFIKTYRAGAAVSARRIVKCGAADYAAIQATAATDTLIGVSTDVASAIDETVDVVHAGIAGVEFGGTVTRGDSITADAQGRGVTAVAGDNSIGVAIQSGAVGEIGDVLLGIGQAANADAVTGVGSNYKVARGSGAVTGTLVVDTGLATVVSKTATLAEDPSANATLVSTEVHGSPGFMTIKVWKPTGASDTAPIASSTETVVDWIAVGT